MLEAGLGGRLDSTNIISTPVLSVITGIALDHTAILGDTVEKIAAEKAGIIKDGVPVIFGGDDDTAADVIKRAAKEHSSEFIRVDYGKLKNINATLEGTAFDYGAQTGLCINLLGLYQPRNASVVLNAVEALNKQGFEITEDALREGLENAVWHARFEKVSKDPLIIFDGAHNPQGIQALMEAMEALFPGKKLRVVVGVLADKDYHAGIAIAEGQARSGFPGKH